MFKCSAGIQQLTQFCWTHCMLPVQHHLWWVSKVCTSVWSHLTSSHVGTLRVFNSSADVWVIFGASSSEVRGRCCISASSQSHLWEFRDLQTPLTSNETEVCCTWSRVIFGFCHLWSGRLKGSGQFSPLERSYCCIPPFVLLLHRLSFIVKIQYVVKQKYKIKEINYF